LTLAHRKTIRHTTQTRQQRAFWDSPHKFRAFIGGVGSGKTRAGVVEILRQPPGTTGVVAAPTYPMLRDATLATFLELTRAAGILTSFNKSEMSATVMGERQVLFRSADNPDRLRGPNLGWFWLDEAALMVSDAWKIMLGRLRRHPGRGWITTTPRGRNWLYHEFVSGGPSYWMTRAPSRSNPWNPPDFVDSLERSYSDLFRRQEVEGEFVDDQLDALFPGQWLTIASQGKHLRSGPRRLAIDLGGGNHGDRTVLMVRDDNGIIALAHSRDWPLETTAVRAAMMTLEHRIPGNRVTWDQIGIGFDFGARLKAAGITGAIAYQAGASGGGKFKNLRAAAGWLARQCLDPGQIAPGSAGFHIPPQMMTLMQDELAAVRWTIDNERKVALEPKEEMAANLGHSPDFADCFIQSFAFPGT
jgi:hypothetical protein